MLIVILPLYSTPWEDDIILVQRSALKVTAVLSPDWRQVKRMLEERKSTYWMEFLEIKEDTWEIRFFTSFHAINIWNTDHHRTGTKTKFNHRIYEIFNSIKQIKHKQNIYQSYLQLPVQLRENIRHGGNNGEVSALRLSGEIDEIILQ